VLTLAVNSFERLTQFKEEILYKFINNQTICKLLYYNFPDALSMSDISNPTSLIYDVIFPYRFIPNVTNIIKSYVTTEFTEFELTRNNPKNINFNLLFYIFTHKDLFVTDNGLRVDLLLNEIDKEIQESKLGFGKVYLSLCRSFWLDNDYGGYALTYKMYE
jgi:hypothetical protein